MSQPQKILTVILWIITVGGMVCVVAMKTLPASSDPAGNTGPSTQPDGAFAQILADPANSSDAPLPVLYPAPTFTLTNQDGKPTTDAELLGHPWVADFIFTTCATLCPTMSARMSQLQDQLPAEVKLVSFSVDPANDTPPILKEYAARYHAQGGRWIFLTGDLKTQERVVSAMKLGFVPAQGNTPIQHDEHFVLIDAQGKIRGFYDSFVPQRMDALARDANSLIAHPVGVAP